MYEKLGRMAGRSYEETVLLLLKGLKNAESQTRAESLVTLEKVCYYINSPYNVTEPFINKLTFIIAVLWNGISGI